ncbi:MAG: TM1812 family CRISPR-associated protein [Labilithrix sp.]|nr:TM1812 family CRISPR-associated protein [Labilithrix sp.]MBX3216454.1 TM1812 family CRISPR-associated protein [Labilithrix sp.]
MTTTLVTVLGVASKPARYTLGGASASADLVPIAIVELLPVEERPSRIIALCTPEATESSWPKLERHFAGSGIETERRPLERDPTDIASFTKSVSAAIPVDCPPERLIVDATHGWRHHAILTYLAMQYISALRGIELRHAFYGVYSPSGEDSPLLDLRALLVLPEWIHGVRLFAERGDATRLCELIGGAGSAARDTAADLKRVADARESGLPVELGQASVRFRHERKRPFTRAAGDQGALLETELWRRLDESLAPFAFSDPIPPKTWKRSAPLDDDELSRQARLIDDLLGRGNVPVALGLMREWTVSLALLQTSDPRSWLDSKGLRRRAESALHALAGMTKISAVRGELSDDQRRLAVFWDLLRDRRNAFHHHGMRYEVLIGSGDESARSKLEQVRASWSVFKGSRRLALLPSPRVDRMLVSAVGLRPGIVASALEVCRRGGGDPDACLVLVSEQSADSSRAVLHDAGYGGAIHQLRIRDPFGGHAEIERLVCEAGRWLVDTRALSVNLTGGTTLMGLAVVALADEAKRLGREVRRFGLVDRRPPAEQDDDTFRTSEAFWLAEGSGHDH